MKDGNKIKTTVGACAKAVLATAAFVLSAHAEEPLKDVSKDADKDVSKEISDLRSLVTSSDFKLMNSSPGFVAQVNQALLYAQTQKCFWAGEKIGAYILHHNSKDAGGGGGGFDWPWEFFDLTADVPPLTDGLLLS
jgi:hypothetical protein